jgi:hypothetical protein
MTTLKYVNFINASIKLGQLCAHKIFPLGKLSTFDPLDKISCFVRKKYLFHSVKRSQSELISIRRLFNAVFESGSNIQKLN